ncbi:hypothetical protein FQN49_007242 [Arthroderma sp. PD_2]|nr:hypothetical protein FQN49_007242 [Arthroderma sp. PD_2]
MPAEIAGVTCAPQKPGTRKSSGEFDGWGMAKLNPCTLNACCSGWGFCGITAEFCTESPADTSASGSFKPGLTDNFNINVGDNIRDQFDIFNDMKAPFKKILSVGRWAESPEAGTYHRYREAVSPKNRYIFTQNVVKFLDSHNPDGIDFDWEYPGASDQGI